LLAVLWVCPLLIHNNHSQLIGECLFCRFDKALTVCSAYIQPVDLSPLHFQRISIEIKSFLFSSPHAGSQFYGRLRF
jgi:hypothetical protein